MQKRNVLHSPRLTELKERRRKAFLSKIFITGIGLAAVFILLAYLSRLEGLNIAAVNVEGNEVIETEILKSVVLEELSGKYLWLFPKTNVLYYPEGSTKEELQNRFKRIGDITFSAKDRKTLEISLTERTPKFTWCGETPPEPQDGDNGQCYFMDESGYIFDVAPYFSGEVYFKFYGLPDASDARLTSEGPLDPSGAYFFKQNFKELVLFKDILIDLGIKPASLYITPEKNIEIFLSSGRGAARPKIILKTDTDFKIVAENLKAALSTEPLMSEFKNKYSSLEYIDLRFGNKVYYRF